MKPIASLFPSPYDLDAPTFAVGGQTFGPTESSGDGSTTTRGSRLSRASSSRKISAQEFLQQKAQQAMARLAAKDTAGPLQAVFPGWDDDRRGLPNSLVRGGLFTAASANSPRQWIKDELVASLSNYSVGYSGEELRQDDLSVWLAIVNMGKSQPLGEPIHFTAYRLITDLKWRIHSETYASLKAIIERLKVTSVKISSADRKSQYAGSLIRDFLFDDRDPNGKTCWTVRLEHSIAKLFLEDTTTLFEWQIRCALGRRASLAAWLFSFYCTHSAPIPYHVEKIHELCKSEDKHIRSFKVNLRAALERLVTEGFLSSYSIQNDVVQVTRARAPNPLRLAAA
jgi:hypothetical protein